MKKSNDLLILILAFLYIIPIFISENIFFVITILFLSFCNLLFLRKINFKYLLYFVLIMVLPIISVFITVLIYSKGNVTSPVIYHICGFNIHKLALENALFLSVRAFSLSFISFLFLLAIQYDALVISLMQNIKLPVSIGYALLATFNAFSYMKNEFLRIQLAYKMRFLKKKFPLTLLFPILVSASRYAYYVSLSLESRGLTNNKTFLESYRWDKKDSLILFINFIELCLLMLYFILINKFSIRLS